MWSVFLDLLYRVYVCHTNSTIIRCNCIIVLLLQFRYIYIVIIDNRHNSIWIVKQRLLFYNKKKICKLAHFIPHSKLDFINSIAEKKGWTNFWTHDLLRCLCFILYICNVSLITYIYVCTDRFWTFTCYFL